MRHLLLQNVPLSDRVVRRKTLLDYLQDGGMATWVCVFLALLLFALFVTLLVGRRSVSSLIAYFATALLPLMAGLCGVAAGTIDALSSLGASGLAYPANYSSALGRIVISFYTGATVTFFGVVGTMVLGFVGPSKASVPPPDPPK